MFKNLFFAVTLIASMLFCANAAVRAEALEADLIVVNARVRTLNPVQPRAPKRSPSSKTRSEAVRAFTVGSAYARFQETNKGSIEPGKLADFVILSADIFSINPNNIEKIGILTTVVDGRTVYQSR